MSGRLDVHTPSGSYPIYIGAGIRHRLGEWLAARDFTQQAVVITDENVAPLYTQDVCGALEGANFAVTLITLPPGERHKNLDTVRRVYDKVVYAGIDRQTPIIALGGGVIGDLSGFVAATVLRGVPFVQMPTTLLAMVDASVGGKTGVDLPQGKNLVGAFKFPEMVIADVDTLATLPQVEIACGLAEVIKHGIIGDPSILEAIRRGHWSWPALVERAVRVKIEVVEEDPFEKGRRAVLNLGHTFAHALEKVLDYRLRHGQAVAMGLVAATRLGVELGLTDPRMVTEVADLVQQVGLPRHWQDIADMGPPPSVDEVLAAMMTDKKRVQQRLRFIVPRGYGRVDIITDVPPHLVREVVAEMLGPSSGGGI